MLRKEIVLVLLPFLLLAASGCRTKLNDESDVSLESGVRQYRMVDPITKEQVVKVAAKAKSGQFDIYFFLDKDKADVEKAFEKGKTSDKLLGHKTNVAEANLEAKVPAGEKAVVMMTAPPGKKADVHLKITN